MGVLDQLFSKGIELIPSGVAVLVVVLVIWVVRSIFDRRYAGESGHRFRIQLFLLIFSFFGLLAVILTLPVSETTIGQLLSLLGILLSAAIALSATTFVGNIMAGLMLRAVKNFRLGDFVRIGDHFGRVSERGLFHIEIQTEDRDLTTLPNLHLVTNPVKVIRSSGTLVSAEVSLGYDVPRTDIETALLKAATEVGLEEAFVHIINLGDFSIVYRLAGLLTDVKSLLSSRSNLRAEMLDQLHQAGIEIVSPTFMNQRVLGADRIFIPKYVPKFSGPEKSKELPEAVVFDKADEAESLDKLRERRSLLKEEIDAAKGAVADATDESSRSELEAKKNTLETRLARLTEYIVQREGGEK